MTKKQKYFFLALPFVFLFSIFVQSADAAILSISADKGSVGIGDEVNIDVKVDTEGVSINAAQGTISFPSNILEATKVDRSNSAFNFWIEEPIFSNSNGTASFIGGVANGISGKSLQIFRLTFRAKSAGLAEFSFSDAAVTSSDGSGTNVLRRMGGTVVNVGAESFVSTPTPTPTATSTPIPSGVPQVVVEQPVKVERTPVPAANLPAAPAVRVPLYPDQTRWFNYTGEAITLWDVPPDIIQVAAKIDQSPNTVPAVPEKELFNGKTFNIVNEGIWYIHIRFKNNIGWGQTTHYKASIDTTTPMPFDIKIDSVVSDNPAPQVTFGTQDALSGISEAVLYINGKELLRTPKTTIVLPIQPPGMYTLTVKVFDKAGNSVEDDLQFEILPLPMPIIEFLSKSVSQGEVIFASGRSVVDGLIAIEAQVLNAARQEIFKGTVQSDSSGNWKISIDKVLPVGKYTLMVVARDGRGASSYPTKEEVFNVRPEIVLSLGGIINLGWLEIFIIATLLSLTGVSLVSWWYVSRKKTREAYGTIVSRDIEKLGAILSGNLKDLEDTQALDDTSRMAQSAVIINKMKKTIAKMKKYIGEEVGKLK